MMKRMILEIFKIGNIDGGKKERKKNKIKY